MGDWSPDDDDAAIVAGKRAIGAAVRARRLRANLSQRQLAWRVNVTQSTISRLETGRLRGMRWQTITRIIGILGVGLELTTGELPRGGPPAPRRRLPGQRA